MMVVLQFISVVSTEDLVLLIEEPYASKMEESTSIMVKVQLKNNYQLLLDKIYKYFLQLSLNSTCLFL